MSPLAALLVFVLPVPDQGCQILFTSDELCLFSSKKNHLFLPCQLVFVMVFDWPATLLYLFNINVHMFVVLLVVMPVRCFVNLCLKSAYKRDNLCAYYKFK